MNTVDKKNAGFSLVSAIFLLIIIAGLGLFAVTFSSIQQQTSVQDIIGSRAYQAAKAGIEWGAFQITQSSIAGTGFVTACQNASALPQPNLPTGTQLSLFTVTLSCSASSHTEGGTLLWIYQLKSTAVVTGTSVGSLNYAERQLQVSIAQ